MVHSLRSFLIAISALGVLTFVVLSIRHFADPMPLHPIETAVLDQSARFVSGKPMYIEPRNGEPASVMPGLPVAASLLARAFDPFLWQGRLIALLAAVWTIGLALLIVRLETGSLSLGIIAAGLVAFSFTLFIKPLGTATVDAPMLALVLSGFVALRMTHGILGAIAAALLFAAAFFTQQTALLFMSAALVWMAFDDLKRGLAFAIAVAVLCGGGFVALSHGFGEWFNYSVWDVPLGQLRFVPGGALHFISDQLLGRLGVMTLAAVLTLALPVQPWRGAGGIWTCAAGAALLAGLFATQTAGAEPAPLLTTLALLAMLGPISLQRVTRHLATWPGSTRLGGYGVVFTALVLQFIALASGAPATLRDASASTRRPEPVELIAPPRATMTPVIPESLRVGPPPPTSSAPSLPR